MLKRLYCDNYKCLVNFEFRPQSLQLLMGRNGAGKSTVFGVLELLRDFAAYGERCEDRLLGGTQTRWQSVREQRFELDVSGNGGEYRYELLLDEWGHPTAPRVLRESVVFDGNPVFLFENGTIHLHNDRFEDRVQFSLDHKRSGLSIVESRHDNRRLMWFKEWLGRLMYIQIDPKLMLSRAEKEASRPQSNLANFGEWYRHLRLEQGTGTEDLRRSLEEVFSGFVSLDLKDAGFNARELQVSIRNGEGKAIAYAFDELSDGQRVLVGLYALLHCCLPTQLTLCIDEPDNFVALAEIQPWLSRLENMRESDSQILLASHHPELLNHLATNNGVILERIDNRQTLARPWASPGDTTLTPAEIVARGWDDA